MSQRNELEKLSEKLNLNISNSDNIELYRQVAYWLGTPHQMGKCSKNGIDCSCFVRLVVQEVFSKNLPRTAAEMHEKSNSIAKNKLKEGDLVFFKIKSRKITHVGVFLKEGWFAHVSTTRGVMINNLSEAYYNQYFDGAGKY